MTITIVPYRAEYASSFAELNLAWLRAYGLMEPSEEDQLQDPQAHFLDLGGQIFVALEGDAVVGTCAVLPYSEGVFELAKLTVAPAFRGRGIARLLVEQCIAYARERNAERIILVSNSQLREALRLYETLGFKYHPVPQATKYRVADVCMVLVLHTPTSAA